MKKYFIYDNTGNQQGPYSEQILKDLYKEGAIRIDTHIREMHSSEWEIYSDIIADNIQSNRQQDTNMTSYLIVLPDGEKEGPYTKAQIAALYRNGRLAGNLLCCQVGTSSWSPLETLIVENSQQTIPTSFQKAGQTINPPRFSSNEDNGSSPPMSEIPFTPNTQTPLQDERSYDSGTEYNMRRFWGMSSLYIVSPLLWASGGTAYAAAKTYGASTWFPSTVFFMGLLYFIYSNILCLRNTWTAWKCIQLASQYGRRIPSARKAIGLLFVPVFNLYWVYVCFVGLIDNASWLARVTRKTSLRLKAWPIFVLVILIQLISFWGNIIVDLFPELAIYLGILSLIVFLWPIAVFWYTERIIQTFSSPKNKEKKSA